MIVSVGRALGDIVVPIAPGTPLWGFDSGSSKTVARDGTGLAPTDGGLVGRLVGHDGLPWQSTADANRPFWRAEAFGGRGGIEFGNLASAVRELRWSGAADFGLAWTVYGVIDVTNGAANNGRLLSVTDSIDYTEYLRADGFNIKLSPGLFSEYRDVFNMGVGIPKTPLPSGAVTFALRFGPRTTTSVVGNMVELASWGIGETPCRPTRAMIGCWVDNNHGESTRSIVGRIDLFPGAHEFSAIQGRLAWYRQYYGTLV